MDMLEALDNRDTPCAKYACKARPMCATGLACNAWRIYVETGRALYPKRFALPTREVFIASERVTGRGEDYKTLMIDRPELWTEAGL